MYYYASGVTMWCYNGQRCCTISHVTNNVVISEMLEDIESLEDFTKTMKYSFERSQKGDCTVSVHGIISYSFCTLY